MAKRKLKREEQQMATVVEAILNGHALIDYPPGEGDCLTLVTESRSVHEFTPTRDLIRRMVEERLILSRSRRKLGVGDALRWEDLVDCYVTAKGYALYLESQGLE